MKKTFELVAITVVLVSGLFLFVLSNHIAGWRAFIVSSGSMEPAIPTGSLVITQQVNPANLKNGEIITFTKPTKIQEFVTHRLTDVSHQGKLTILKTKGDNNKERDNWVVAGGAVVGKVMYSIPQFGYFLSFSKTKIGLALFVLIPSLYILYMELTNILGMIGDWRKKAKALPVQIVVFLFVVGSLMITRSDRTYAFLSDHAALITNTFTVTNDPAACSSPTTTITISGNGSGSVNTVIVNGNKIQVNSKQ